MLGFFKGVAVIAVAVFLCASLYNFVILKDSRDYIQELHDMKPSVRMAAAVALGERKSMKSVAALRKAIQDEKDFTIREAMQKAMYKCSGLLPQSRKP